MQSCLTAKMLEKLQGGAENLFAQLPKHQYFLFDGFFLARLRTLPANLLKVLKVKSKTYKQELKGRLSYIPNIKCFFRDLFSQAAEKIFQIEKA